MQVIKLVLDKKTLHDLLIQQNKNTYKVYNIPFCTSAQVLCNNLVKIFKQDTPDSAKNITRVSIEMKGKGTFELYSEDCYIKENMTRFEYNVESVVYVELKNKVNLPVGEITWSFEDHDNPSGLLGWKTKIFKSINGGYSSIEEYSKVLDDYFKNKDSHPALDQKDELENEEDEDGWIKVSSKSMNKRRRIVTSGTSCSVSTLNHIEQHRLVEKQKEQQQKSELSDFYKFQRIKNNNRKLDQMKQRLAKRALFLKKTNERKFGERKFKP